MDGWLVSLFSFFASFIIGLTSIGAGSIITSGLILLFSISPLTAVSASLAHNFLIKSTGGIVHLKRKNYDGRILKWFILGCFPPSFLLPFVLETGHILNTESQYILAKTIGALIIIAVVCSFFQKQIINILKPLLMRANLRLRHILVMAGFFVGAVVSITSVGSGPLVLVAFLFVSSLSPNKAVGTTILAGIAISFAASISYAVGDLIRWDLVFSMLVGSIPGMILGSLLVPKINSKYLKKGLMFLLFFVGLKLLIG